MPTTIIANHLGNRAGTWSATIDRRSIGYDESGILAEGLWDSGPLNTTQGEPSLIVRALPDGTTPFQVTVKVVLFGGSVEIYRLNFPDSREMIDLGSIPLSSNPEAPPAADDLLTLLARLAELERRPVTQPGAGLVLVESPPGSGLYVVGTSSDGGTTPEPGTAIYPGATTFPSATRFPIGA